MFFILLARKLADISGLRVAYDIMSDEKTLRIESTSSNATEQLAEQIGSKLKGGEVIELTSDLGGGKTTFTRGLVRGARSTDHVSSPTFTISNIYQTSRFAIHHFDFYRLPEAGLIAHELQDVLEDKNAVLVVEWAGVVEDVLPSERLAIHIARTGEEERSIVVTCPPELRYLLEGIQ